MKEVLLHLIFMGMAALVWATVGAVVLLIYQQAKQMRQATKIEDVLAEVRASIRAIGGDGD